ncbi:CENPM-like protein [Mya arenaria]|uniref:Centromere protein M n=1 Tax=Mya arenaria TaxID=6604 RepID=A0ABY7E1P1_MYAAR|nr:uncharacterized protein LOC128231173 [Mya arenaria]WAR03089.1 CENPM-like protein [Mya arenaria]
MGEPRILVIGIEGTGTREISACLLKQDSSMDVLTCSSLPLPGDRDLHECGIQFICFMICAASKESFQTLHSSISQVDVSYFAGKCVIVENTKGLAVEQSVEREKIEQLAAQYDIPVLTTNTQNESELTDISNKLQHLIRMNQGRTRHLAPMLYECVRETKLPRGTPAGSNLATPSLVGNTT